MGFGYPCQRQEKERKGKRLKGFCVINSRAWELKAGGVFSFLVGRCKDFVVWVDHGQVIGSYCVVWKWDWQKNREGCKVGHMCLCYGSTDKVSLVCAI